MNGHEVTLTSEQYCCICESTTGAKTVANYDARINRGSWGYVCTPHWELFCDGVGVGIGQKINYKLSQKG